MGRFCLLCESIRPNEHFRGGKGQRSRICRKCRQLTREAQDARLQEREIRRFLEQSHISKKNVTRLRTLTQSQNTRIAELAALIADIAKATPHRRRRIRTLAQAGRRDVLDRMERAGLIEPRCEFVECLDVDDINVDEDIDPTAAWYEWVEQTWDHPRSAFTQRPDISAQGTDRHSERQGSSCPAKSDDAVEHPKFGWLCGSAMSPRDQFIQGIDNPMAFVCERLDELSQLVFGDRRRFQRMQNHRRFFDDKRGIEARMADLIDI